MPPKGSAKAALKRPGARQPEAVQKRPAALQGEEALGQPPVPKATRRARQVPEKPPLGLIWESKWGGDKLWPWFAIRVPDPTLRSQLSLELHQKQRDRSTRVGQHEEKPFASQPVCYHTLVTLKDGFALCWRIAVQYRAGWMFWKRKMQKLVKDPSGSFEVEGLDEKPEGSSAVFPSEVTTHRDFMQASSRDDPQLPVGCVADQAAQSASTDLVAEVPIQWPRFPARRLAGGMHSEEGVGGAPEMYSVGDRLGSGTFAVVHKTTVGGWELAVKVLSKSHLAEAFQEASVAEHLRDLPHIVHLLDACIRPSDSSSLLVYRFAGSTLRAWAETHKLDALHVQIIVAQAATGLGHLHARGLYHSDVKPENILVKGSENNLEVIIADLGGCVEVGGMGLRRLPSARTTVWFRSPELLLGQGQARADTWMKADVWALGIVACSLVGQDFYRVDLSGLKKDSDGADRVLKALHKVFPFQADSPTRSYLAPLGLVKEHGSSFVDCLKQMLEWDVDARPSIHRCLENAWLCISTMRPFGSTGKLQPGGRHPWSMVSGIMTIDVLEWLRLDFCDTSALRKGSHKTEGPGGLKAVISGKTIQDPGCGCLNGLDTKSWLPTPHVLAWMRAWKTINGESLAKLTEAVRKSLRYAYGEGIDLGENGDHFMRTPVWQWVFTVGQVHLFKAAGSLEEQPHFDGGASVLHMGMTFFGRRRVRMYEADEKGPYSDALQLLGSVYVGVLTGAKHQVLHEQARHAEELQGDHAITAMMRCSLFPAPRSRLMAHVPFPSEMFMVLAESMAENLLDLSWRLPTLADCLAAYAETKDVWS